MANIDLEMGQFQKVTTLENKDYIVVSLDNGTQGQIKVSDLASVVAGILNLNTRIIRLGMGLSYRIARIRQNGIFSMITTYAQYANIHGNHISLCVSFFEGSIMYSFYGQISTSFELYFVKTDSYVDLCIQTPLFSDISLLVLQGWDYENIEIVSSIPENKIKFQVGDFTL